MLQILTIVALLITPLTGPITSAPQKAQEEGAARDNTAAPDSTQDLREI